MLSKIEVIEPGIISLAWEGVLDRGGFTEGVHARKVFADEHHDAPYILIYDLRAAKISTLDARLSRWGAEFDQRMIHVIILGDHLIAQVLVNILAGLTKARFEFATTPEDALERARARLSDAAL